MRSNLLQTLAACGFALLHLACPPTHAAESKAVFDSLFSAKIKTVIATVDRADDIALAKEMLAIAKTSTNQPELLALLCDGAHDLAVRHADGFATAVEAQQLLAEHVETRRSTAQDKMITLLTRQMTAGKADEREPATESLIDLLMSMGDEKFEKKQYTEAAADYRRSVTVATQRKSTSLEEAKAKLEFAAARDRAVKNLARLQEKLLKDANDSATAEEIVKIYVIELDDPAGALPFLNRVKDEEMEKSVALASQDRSRLGETELLSLVEWYAALRQIAPQSGSLAGRIARYGQQYLDMNPSQGLQRVRVQALVADVKKIVDSSVTLATPSKPAKMTGVARPANLVLSGNGYALGKLANGEVAFSNRGFIWQEVPKDFEGWTFTRKAGGGRASIKAQAKTSGLVFIATNTQPLDARWKPMNDRSFHYNDKEKSRLFIYVRTMNEGDTVDIPQSDGWIGTILILPTSGK